MITLFFLCACVLAAREDERMGVEMKEYIEREAAIKEFLNNGSIFVYGKQQCKAIVSRINAIPAADVRPVVRAKWVYTDMSRLVCSNCGNPVAFALKEGGWHHGDFCPNCGADMREEQDGR